jgi:2-polyprenyl-6-methoxyphenol hydroxylase-like FAD-dependent oxidoreductase
MLDELGMAGRLHERQHVKMYGPTAPGSTELLFDFRDLLHTKFPYLMWMPQEVFLSFLAEEGRQFPAFHLVMGANVQDLLVDPLSPSLAGKGAKGAVRGVRYRAATGWHEVRALLTVAADGRFSRVRKLAGIKPIPTSAPVELLWFRLPRLPGDPPGTGVVSPRFGKGQLMLMIDRADHWQVGYFFPAGQYNRLKQAGVAAMQDNIVQLEPRFAENVQALTDWQQFTLLSVASSRCRRWYRPGLLLIGDAAHTMTPAAGAGIKYAIEDAIVAANVLATPLLNARLRTQDLAEVQRQREWPTRFIQAFGALGLRNIARAMRTGNPQSVPQTLRFFFRLPVLPRILAQLVAFGFWRVHVK